MRGRTLGIGAAVVAVGIVAAGVYAATGSDNTAAVACAMDDAQRAAVQDAARGEVAGFTIADAPTPMSELAFADGDGKPVTLAEFAGKTVLVNLWATWCVPCRVEMPALDALQAELGGDAFQVVPISVDLGSDAKPKAFYDETGLKALPFYHDAEIDTLQTLKRANLAVGLPATVLVDSAGCAQGALFGPAEWASEDAKRFVRAALDAG